MIHRTLSPPQHHGKSKGRREADGKQGCSPSRRRNLYPVAGWIYKTSQDCASLQKDAPKRS